MVMPDKGDFEDELFGPVIFSYTDRQALDDGVLVDVSRLSKHGINRITRALYGWLGGFEKPGDFATEYRGLEDAAKVALDRSEDKEFLEFTYKDAKFFLAQNETGYRTLMFPEDY
jgi:hypothetical protein